MIKEKEDALQTIMVKCHRSGILDDDLRRAIHRLEGIINIADISGRKLIKNDIH